MIQSNQRGLLWIKRYKIHRCNLGNEMMWQEQLFFAICKHNFVLKHLWAYEEVLTVMDLQSDLKHESEFEIISFPNGTG